LRGRSRLPLTGKGLADLGAVYSEPVFGIELERVIAAEVGRATAPVLAECLRLVYHPEPKCRPTDVVDWAETVASLLDSARP